MSEFLTCDQIKDLISPYFDRELSNADEKLVENHIKTCPECRQELENIKQLSFSIQKSYQPGNTNNADEIFAYKKLLPENIQTCLEIKSNLSAFIDGELDRDDTINILEHIINCQFCRKQYEKIRKAQELTKNYFENIVNQDIYHSQSRKTHITILEKIREEKNRKKILSSAAALIFVAVLSWFSIFQFNSIHTDEINIDKTKFIKKGRPMYVKSEDYILTELNSTPPEEVISLLYGD